MQASSFGNHKDARMHVCFPSPAAERRELLSHGIELKRLKSPHFPFRTMKLYPTLFTILRYPYQPLLLARWSSSILSLLWRIF